MTDFILDNSVSIRWLSQTGKRVDQDYAESVLKSFTHADALVPNLWHLEVVNVTVGLEKRNEINTASAVGFLAQLENLPIYADPLTANQAFGRITALARGYNLSSYDAAYLELSIRENLPLATLDKTLRKAAVKANVPLYLQDSSNK